MIECSKAKGEGTKSTAANIVEGGQIAEGRIRKEHASPQMAARFIRLVGGGEDLRHGTSNAYNARMHQHADVGYDEGFGLPQVKPENANQHRNQL